MSIVERVIGKLQQTGQPVAPTAQAALPVGRELRAGGPRVSIDLERLRAAGMLAPQKHAARLAEEYRRIKRPLLHNAVGEARQSLPNGNLIMVASAVPGDGKTFTALNLALSLALEPNQPVVLVDADVARSSLSGGLGIREVQGLVDVLGSDKLGITDVLIDTDYHGLKLLSAGQKSEASAELVARKRMAALFNEFAATYPHCIVVFDSSPLLATNVAQVLAGVVGQVVFVVRADSTPVPAVEEAIAMLDPNKSLSIVLNQAQVIFGKDYQHGGYY